MVVKSILCVAAIAAATFSVYGIALSDEAIKIIADCAKNSKLDIGAIINAVKNQTPPKTQEEKCFVDCVARGVGLIKDSTFDTDRAKELAAGKLKNKPNILEKTNQVIDFCAPTPVPAGQCEYAVALMTCSIRKAKELGIPNPSGFA